ncbi:MAG: transmembrane 220 family protein [Leptospiraceae bacterium]|nr:transmembrane 220 family protein [Leptospiraceae bacterium]
MRITNFILSFMFLLFAAVQYNDPDPLIWICIYTYAAIMCLLAGLGKYYKILLIAGILFSFVWAITLAASIFLAFKNYGAGSLFSFSMIKDTEVEEARESLGLIIVSAVLLWKFWEGKRKLSY